MEQYGMKIRYKEIEGDEYDLVDGYVLCDFSGEV